MKPFDARILDKIVHFDLVAPSVTDDAAHGYHKGQLWVDTEGDTTYICTSHANGEATWLDLSGAAGITPDGVATLTNKRITRRVMTLTDAAVVASSADTTDVGQLLSTQNFTLANPTGTPTARQIIEYVITSAASRTIAYDTQFVGTDDLALPTATTGSDKADKMLFEWNATTSKWELLAKNFGA